MNGFNVLQAAASAGILAGVAYVMNPSSFASGELLKLAAFQAGCSLASDAAHKALQIESSAISDSLATGAFYAAINRFVLGNNEYDFETFAVSAGSQFAAATGSSLFKSEESQ